MLEVILRNFKKIFQFFTNKNEEYKKIIKNGENIKNPVINIIEFAKPDRKDCFQTIYDLYCSIIDAEVTHAKEYFINFSSSFFESYINYFDTISLDNLIKVKDMITFLKNN